MGAMKLSLGVGILMLVIKVCAFVITGSTAIFSDAAESVVHNFACAFALYSMWFSSKPADRSHPYGHDKISYFSAGFEGTLIVVAAFIIIVEASRKWMHGLEIENLGAGILFTVAAAVINAALGFFLVWRGKKYHSIILEANGRHVLTDSWTSLGVIVGLGLAKATGWLPFDPICAILVAFNILWAGFGLMRRSIGGLMDEADPETTKTLRAILDREVARHGMAYHELRHRKSGRATWVELHLLFPDETHIKKAHAVATEIEEVVEKEMGGDVHVTTHLEPRVDHARIHHS
jgi:cation diffusion facilitator family transporter